MLDFRRADAMRQRAESAMGRGVAVAADDRHARQGEALLRADDVHDALAAVLLGIIFDAEIGGVLGQRFNLDAAFLVLDAVHAVRRSRHVVVDHGQRLFRVAHLAAGHAQAFEGLRAGHFVDQVAVDIEQAGAVVLPVDHMVIENLVVEGARRDPSIESWMRSQVQVATPDGASACCQPEIRLVSDPATRAKNRDGRRFLSCSTKPL
jgi:hypothetical protein